jgi:hypothetical protein
MSVTPFPVSGSHYATAHEPHWPTGAAALGDTIRALALTLMGQTTSSVDTTAHDEWRKHFRGLLRPLREAFAEHRAATEGDEGLYAEVVQDAPRLAGAVNGLVAEHYSLDSAIARLVRIADEVSGDAEVLRRRAHKVLDDLARHRQHDADLVHEAYGTDIGGE